MTSMTEKNYAQLLGKVTCPGCANSHIRRATRTSELVYLRCEDCGLTWPIAERRKPRSSAATPADDTPE
jgi:predicted RNA-binding Zn-ribbon protein involved in translation (DUF1610 family)